jgi:septal ring factor EnvC (AmiA/AmiB activator)
MDENNEEDVIRKFLDQHAKRMERIVQSRFNSVMDQLNKLASDNQAMAVRIFNIEKVIRSMSAANYYNSQDLQFIRNELEALELYLAESDPRLAAILKASLEQKPPNLPPSQPK